MCELFPVNVHCISVATNKYASPEMNRAKKTRRSRWLWFVVAIATARSLPAQNVNVDASMAHQTLEGWGTSLAWFANSVGGWTNTSNRTSFMNALFNPTSGLGLTYLRYNIGGGDNPNCGHAGYYACIRPAWHAVPGYEPTPGTYDWTQDANQRWVAHTAQTLGANLFEAVSYSPPYWMTNSGTSQGGVNGAENLASGYYGSGSGTFADYLTTVARHFSSNWGITFHHLEPLNEPGQTWWKAGDKKQEGCGFSVADQQTTIQNVAASLTAKGVNSTSVSAMDEYQEGVLNSAAGSTAYEFHNYSSATISDFTALNSHGYACTYGSVALATDAQRAGKRLTMSEWGTSNDTTGQNLSTQILLDIKLTRAVAWSIWQPDWPAIMSVDYMNQSYTLNEAYYVFENFTRFIRPGFQFIAISDPQSLAAYNAQTKTVVIVALNWTGSSRSVNYQLSNFFSLGSSAAVYQTSSTEQLASLANVPVANGAFSDTVPGNSVTTFVIKNTSYAPAATTVNDNATGTAVNQFNYIGTWSYYPNQTGAYDNDNHRSSTTNSYYTFQFSGQQARVYGSMAPNGGIVAFSVDNGAETYFDTYAPSRVDNEFLFATPTLGNGMHTLKVRVTGLKHPASSGYNLPADRIDVLGAGTKAGQDIYRIVNVKNGLDLEVNSASLADGGTVDTYRDVPGANNEDWNLMAVGDGSYRIVNVNSGLDLEVSGASKSNGGKVDQWQDSGASATNEHWMLLPVSGGYRIVNVNSGLDLELNRTTGVVDQWQDVSGTPNEHWTLTLAN
ncbi:MAG TPA: RICIN domain-containing protein [Acidobacteriaceae bacterium]|nr:RICIN domain-containing protein [Acidobacteriaceae bacterium]